MSSRETPERDLSLVIDLIVPDCGVADPHASADEEVGSPDDALPGVYPLATGDCVSPFARQS